MKYAALIQAALKGEIIEARYTGQGNVGSQGRDWHPIKTRDLAETIRQLTYEWIGWEYRVHVPPPPDKERYVNVYELPYEARVGFAYSSVKEARKKASKRNKSLGIIKYVLDGVTDEMKSVELVKE